jgi:hypothetical protein
MGITYCLAYASACALMYVVLCRMRRIWHKQADIHGKVAAVALECFHV